MNKARDRAHILVGLAIAVSNIDEIIKLIRASKSPSEAKEELMSKEWPAKEVQPLIELIDDPRHGISKKGFCTFSEEQAKAILELRLQRLTAIGKEDIEAELDGLKKDIEGYLLTLKSKDRVIDIIKKELIEIKNNFSIPRRTEIIEYVDDVQDEDLIKKEEKAVTVSHTCLLYTSPSPRD